MIKHELSRIIENYLELSRTIMNCRNIQLPLVYYFFREKNMRLTWKQSYMKPKYERIYWVLQHSKMSFAIYFWAKYLTIKK